MILFGSSIHALLCMHDQIYVNNIKHIKQTKPIYANSSTF